MRILLGIDGTDTSFRAFDRTVERVRETGDDLGVAVVETAESPLSVEEVESRVRERLAETGVDAEVVALSGHAGSRLVEYAEREGYDRIVLGGGQRSPLGKVTLGGVVEFVLLNAEVTVTLIR